MRKIFLEKLLVTIKSHNMITYGDSIIIGLSGGADSVALLYSLNFLKEKYNLKLYCLHINHGIRGKIADSDMAFSEKISLKSGVPFFKEFVDIPSFAKQQQISVETAGRQIRYNLFLKYAKKLNANKVATGHHSDDQAETILMRIIRGTGSLGFKGILPIRENFYIRPLLDVSKKEILELLTHEKLQFREDFSNYDSYYFRNKVRNDVFPILEEINPNIKKRLCVMRKILSDENDFLTQESLRIFLAISRTCENCVYFDIAQIKSHHIAIQRLLIKKAISHILQSDSDIGFNIVDSGIFCLNHNSFGKSISVGKLTFEKDCDIFKIYKTINNKDEIPVSYKIDGIGEYNLPYFDMTMKVDYSEGNENVEQSDKDKVFFDLKKVKFPLEVRKRVEGDTFRPIGINGSKKLKDFFIDEKVSRNMRDRIPILTDSSGNIMWVCKMRMSSLFKTDKGTKKILKITCIKGSLCKN